MSARGIGGYLELEAYRGTPIHGDAIALDCGRNCLAYLAELRGIRAVWLPDFLCDTVASLCAREGVEVRLYQIGDNLLPVYDFEVKDGEWFYLVDYYGQLSAEDVRTALEFSRDRLVVDETHGFYRPTWKSADTLWSCRKWFGVPDGAYLATRDGSRLDFDLQRCESRGRMAHILGRAERPAYEFLEEHRHADRSFAAEPVSCMSTIAESLLAAVDYEAVAEQRRANWNVLHAELAASNLLDVRVHDVPFMYPYLVEDATYARELLAARDIFVPTLWPSVLCNDKAGRWAKRYAMHLLPLPIDQRYGEEDMLRVADTVRDVFGTAK